MKKEDFILTKLTSPEVTDNVDVWPLAETLNANIRLSDYGTGVSKIFFTFVAVPPSNRLHENEARYDAKTKTLDLSLNLSYEHVLTAGKEEVLQMMAIMFLVSVDLWERFKIADFDRSSFKDEVEKLFAKQGLLEPAKA